MIILKSKAVLRSFHFFLIFCIIFTVSFSSTAVAMGTPSSSVPATDIKGNPAESQISYFLKKGILTVYSNKTFKPNQIIKRIEFITAVNKLFGFSQTTNISFKDVPANSTNYKEVSKAISAGYIGGFSDKTFKPNNAVTRQEAAQIICKLLNYTASKNSSILTKIKDINFTSSSYLSYISTAVQNGYLELYSGNRFNPSKKLTRAETAYLFSKMTKTVFNKAGSYSDADGSKTVKGNVIVNTAGVTLNNLVINGNLYLTQGINEGNASLMNVTVKGNTYINGGGLNSITIMNSTLGAAFINKKNGAVRVVTSGSTNIGNLTVNSSCSLVESSLTGNGFTNMTVNLLVPKGPIELMGSFANITLNSKMTEIDLSKGSINNFTSSQGASGTTLRVASSASIENIVLNATAKVLGNGSIKTVDIRSAEVTVEPKPTYVTVKKGITAIVNGLIVKDTVSFLPSLTSAVINLSTGKLTLYGENLVSITGTNNDITAAKLTISSGVFGHSRTLTASSNADIISSTSAVLKLTDADITAIKSMLTSSSKSYKISAAMGWNGPNSPLDYSGNKVTISGNQPVINSATLNLSTGTLVLSGLYFKAVSGSVNDITASKLTISDGNGGHSRTLSYTANVEITNSSSAKLTLSSTDLTAIKTWALQNGISVNGYSYNIAAAANWNGTNSPADLTGNPVTVSGNQLPTITSATFTVSTGKLFLTGTNFISISGASNDITASKLTFSDGYGGHSRTLSTSSNVDISSSTTATITVSGADLTAISSWAVQNGTLLNGYAYNISAAAGWNGSDSQADLTGNPVTVSTNSLPDITSATLDLSNGYLTLYGTNLVSITGSNNDINSSYLTISDGSGGHSRVLSYTSNFDITNSSYARVTLSSTDLASITNWATQNGSSVNGYPYLVTASAGWNGTGSYYDSSNPLTVNGAQASNITSATLNLSTGQLVLYGNFVSISGTNNDIIPSLLTISDGSGGHSRTLYYTYSCDIGSSSYVSIYLSSSDLSSIAAWAVQNGTALNGYPYYISASGGWNGTGSSYDSSNTLTVSGNAAPSISSATFNVSNGQLVLSGVNFNSLPGYDINASLLTIRDSNGSHIRQLSTTSSVDISSSSSATLTVAGTDLTEIKKWATQNGTSLNGYSYYLNASANWNGPNSPDDSSNTLYVSGNGTQTITNATLDISSRLLTINGSNFSSIAGGANDINLACFTLSDGTASGSTQLSGSIELSNSSSTVSVTLSQAVIDTIKAWATQNGTWNGTGDYNIAASANWNGSGSSSDLTGNTLTITGYPSPAITSATLNFTASSAVLTLTGTNFIKAKGSANDIDLSKLYIHDGAGHSTTLSSTNSNNANLNIDITNSTTAVINLGDNNTNALKAWVMQNGTSLYKISTNANWNGSGSPADSIGKPVTVSGLSSVSIVSASRNSSTQITVVLNKPVVTLTASKENNGGFSVCDAVYSDALSYNVTKIEPANGNYWIVLTVGDTSNSANVLVKYTIDGNGNITDQDGGILQTTTVGIPVMNSSAPALKNPPALNSNGKPNETVIFNLGSGRYKYIVSTDSNPISTPITGTVVNWADVKNGDIINAENGKYIGIAEVDGNGKVLRFSNVTAVSSSS